MKEMLYEVRCLKSNEDMIMGSNPVESPEFFRFMRQLKKLLTHTFSMNTTTWLEQELSYFKLEYLLRTVLSWCPGSHYFFPSKVIDEVTNFLTKGKSRLSLPEKTTVLDMLTSGNQVITHFLLRYYSMLIILEWATSCK